MLQNHRLARATAALCTFQLAGAPIPKFPGTARLDMHTASQMAKAALDAAYPTSTGYRTFEDYAIEFGEYLAVSCTAFMEAADELAVAREVLEGAETSEEKDAVEALVRAEEAYFGAASTLRSAIYEFRKRAARAGAKVAE